MKPTLNCLLWLSILMGGVQRQIVAQKLPPVVLLNSPKVSINSSVWVLRDSTQQLTLGEVMGGQAHRQFRPNQQLVPNWGTTTDDAWAYFRVQNQLPKNQFPVLEIGYINYSSIDLYVIDSTGKAEHFVTGNDIDKQSELATDLPGQTHALRLPIARGHTATVYLRLHTSRGQQYFPLTLWSEKAYLHYVTSTTLLWGGYYGIFILVILYHLFVFASTSERSYGFLLCYLLLMAFWEFGRGYNLIYPTENLPDWLAIRAMPVAYLVSYVSLAFFFEYMLQIRHYLPWYRYVLYGMLAVCVLGITIILFNPQVPLNQVLITVTLPILLTIMLASVYALYKNPSVARFYVLAIISIFVGGLIFTLHRNGLIESESWFIKFSTNAGSTLEFVFLTLAIADSLRHERRIRRQLHEQTIQQQARAEAERQQAQRVGQVTERQRVAYELHNNLGGNLYGLRLLAKQIQPDQLADNGQEAYQALNQALREAHEQVRLISHNLMPQDLIQKGLHSAINRLIDDLNRLGRTDFLASLNDAPEVLIPDTLKFDVYTILMELTQNILKHASEAESAFIRLRVQNRLLEIQVSDDGHGMPDLTSGEPGRGTGLQRMKERVMSLQGELFVERLPTNDGTQVRIFLPLPSGN